MNLTRDSCKAAFRNGITTDQICDFLEVHCHPIVREQGAKEAKVGASIVPNNIKDQLRLWEEEQDRVEVRCAALFILKFSISCRDDT